MVRTWLKADSFYILLSIRFKLPNLPYLVKDTKLELFDLGSHDCLTIWKVTQRYDILYSADSSIF